MKYRIYALLSLLALGVGTLMAQDYDDIYYDASKSSSSKAKTVKVVTPAKTVAVYGEVPEKYKEAVQSNYSTDRDVDEYNRRGAYEPNYEVTITGDTVFYGDTIYEEAFANTRRIERFYNPDIVILSDDEELVQLYYDESPTINLIVGSDWGLGSYYGYGWSTYYPWYTDWYDPWYTPWYYGSWYPYWHHSSWYWWGYNPWHYSSWRWGWNHHYWSGWYGWDSGRRYNPYVHHSTRFVDTSARPGGHRGGLATNRNGRSRVDVGASNRNGISARGANGSRSSGVGNVGTRNRGGYASTRGGNMGSRSSSGVTTRRSSSTGGYSSGSRSSGGYSSGSRSSGGYSSSGRSSGSSSYGGSRSSSSSSGGSYSSGGGSRGGSGGGSHGGSSGGGGRRH